MCLNFQPVELLVIIAARPGNAAQWPQPEAQAMRFSANHGGVTAGTYTHGTALRRTPHSLLFKNERVATLNGHRKLFGLLHWHPGPDLRATVLN